MIGYILNVDVTWMRHRRLFKVIVLYQSLMKSQLK